MAHILYETNGPIATFTINRPERRNAFDRQTAIEFYDAVREFEADDNLKAGILTGAGGCFCAGADLKAASEGGSRQDDRPDVAPMGPSRIIAAKPVIAAVEGYAVAGGLELALWCDLRVAASDAVFGVFCRRWGIPLIDGGTVRLARTIGQGRALDMILTGRGVSGDEAVSMGLVNRLTEPGKALEGARDLAETIAAFPQGAALADRRSVYEQWSMPLDDALMNEDRLGREVVATGATSEGARRFAAGAGRHGTLEDGSKL